MPSTPQNSLGVRRSPRLVNKQMSNYHEVSQDKNKGRNLKRTKRSKTKRLIHSEVTLEIDSRPAPSGDDTSQAGTTETDGDRLPSRTEEVEYITIDDEELEAVNLNAFF